MRLLGWAGLRAALRRCAIGANGTLVGRFVKRFRAVSLWLVGGGLGWCREGLARMRVVCIPGCLVWGNGTPLGVCTTKGLPRWVGWVGVYNKKKKKKQNYSGLDRFFCRGGGGGFGLGQALRGTYDAHTVKYGLYQGILAENSLAGQIIGRK